MPKGLKHRRLSPRAALDQLRDRLPYEKPGEDRLRALAAAVDGLDAGLEMLARASAIMGLDELVEGATLTPFELPGGHLFRAVVQEAAGSLAPGEASLLRPLVAIEGHFDRRLAEATAGPDILLPLSAAEDLGLAVVQHHPDGGQPWFSLLSSLRHLWPQDAGKDAYHDALNTRAAALVNGWWLRRDDALEREVRLLGPLMRRSPEAGPIVRVAVDLIDGPGRPAAERLASLGGLQLDGLSPAQEVHALLCLADAQRVAGRVSEARATVELAQPRDDRVLQTLCTLAQGQLDMDQGQYPAAVQRLVGHLERHAQLDPALHGWLHTQAASGLMNIGRPSEAVEHLERALDCAAKAPHHGLAAIARGNLGVLMVQRDREVARGHLDAAASAFRAIGDLNRLAVADVNLAGLAIGEGALEVAEMRLAEALDAYNRTGNRRGAAIVASNLGELLHGRDGPGDRVSARKTFADGMEGAAACEARVLEAVLTSQLGRLELESGRWSEALGLLERAVSMLDAEDDAVYGALAHAALAVCQGLLGDGKAADASLERAEAAILSARADVLLGALEAFAAALSSAHAAGAAARSDEEARQRHEAEAARRLEKAAGLAPGTDRTIAERIARQLLALPSTYSATEDGLLVAPGCTWFRWAGKPVDLSRRPTLARVLEALVSAWPEPSSGIVLFARAWPEEKALRNAQQERVRAAIAALRKLGLRDILERDKAGYRLTPDLVLKRWPPRHA